MLWWIALAAGCLIVGFVTGALVVRAQFIKRQESEEWALIAGRFRREADQMRGRLVELEHKAQGDEPEEDEEDG